MALHTIILPALLLAHGKGWRLPNRIFSSEYLTLEGRKISTSKNDAIWVKDLLERYEADSIRYFFLANGPEKKDADFSWREYVHSHNGELLGAYGNFVNRTLAFIAKSAGSCRRGRTIRRSARVREYVVSMRPDHSQSGGAARSLSAVFVGKGMPVAKARQQMGKTVGPRRLCAPGGGALISENR